MSNTLEYPTELGSPPIVKFDIDEHKKTQLDSVHYHANKQIQNLKEQANLLTRQAQQIYGRIELAEKILRANFAFKPVLLKPYYLYQKNTLWPNPVLHQVYHQKTSFAVQQIHAPLFYPFVLNYCLII